MRRAGTHCWAETQDLTYPQGGGGGSTHPPTIKTSMRHRKQPTLLPLQHLPSGLSALGTSNVPAWHCHG